MDAETLDNWDYNERFAQDADLKEMILTSPFAADTSIAVDEDSDGEVETWEEKAEAEENSSTNDEADRDALADYFLAEFLRGDGEGDGDDEPSLGRGVTLDKEQSPEGEDYSVGRWVAFPDARMSGKVRQIVDHAPSECGFMAYWLTSPELEPSNRFKTIGMKLNGYKSFGTKEDAEKYLQEAEGEIRKKILQIVTKDSLPSDRIFDPEEFDQNSFEWGAIYWINQIRDAVEEFEDGYVIPDEQFVEMLRPLWKAAKVYAEAHGKDKAWVKNTVLSVPKAFANAFDTLSDGEGVSKEHFLKVLTVEGVCALAEGDIDSVHELEDYYYRKGRYSPKGGYEVGRFVVIIKDPPSQKYESERIRRIIAICGEKDDDDPTLVFWNTSQSGIVKRKASQCSKPFHKCDEAYDWWFVENGEGARELKGETQTEEAAIDGFAEDGFVGVICGAYGFDAEPDMAEADFWAKHDKARHGGHFDPETMTCKLREKYAQGEKIENLRDEMDDIGGERPDGESSGDTRRGEITPEEDAAYMEAVEKGDFETAAKMVREAAAKSFPDTKIMDTDGKPMVVWHATEWNPYTEPDGQAVFREEKIGTAHDNGYYGQGFYFGRSKNGVRQYLTYKNGELSGNVFPFFLNIKNPCIKPARGLDSDTPKENDGIIVGGDRYYEKPYDDPINWGEFVVYFPNQIKSAAPVTYDGDGNVIPLSHRFDDGSDIRGDVNWRERGDLTSAPEYDIISPENSHKEGEKDVQSQGDNVPEQADRDEMGGEQSQGVRPHSILAAASAIGRGVEGRVQESTRVRDKEAESAARITEYAKENGIWRDDIEKDFDSIYGTKDTQKNTEGGESIVWFDKNRGVVVKAIGLDYYGSPTLALERVELHNKYFPHAPLNVVGFGEVKDTYGADGDIAQYGRPFNIIAEQPLIDTTTELTKDEIRDRLESMGFKVVGDNGDAGWDMETPDGLAIVSDLHERNVFGTRDGSVAVIDCDIRKRTKEDLAKSLSRKHPNIDADRVLEHLAKFKSAEEKESEFRRILSSGKIAEDSLNEVIAAAIEATFVIGQDALNPNDPMFWQKHDQMEHGGHFDPERQSCKLREEMGLPTVRNKEERNAAAEEAIEREDDIGENAPDVMPKEETSEIENSSGISKIFTGSVSDYAKPSLLHVGSGEGTQVYGYGLYGSTLRNDAEYYAAKAQGNFVPKPGASGEQVIYEQTFFNNRKAGDESHLLSWYDPVSDENKQRIDAALEKVSGNKMDWTGVHSGEDLYRKLATFASPQEASEFLAHNADIDGIKYPAEDHHGRQVGNSKGWNYVSFRDDNIRIDRKYVNGQKVYDFQELMAKKLPGIDAIAVLKRISKMGSPEKMAEEFRRILRSGKTGNRKAYGVPYQGSKSRIAKSIVDILPEGKRFVDLFSGGGAVTHAAMESGKYGNFRMNDLDGRGQRLFLEGAQGKWDDYSRDTMTPEEFSKIKGTPESLPWSFNGLGRNLARPVNGRDYASEQISRVKSLSSLKDRSKDVESSETDYSEVKLQPGDIVYADIPYESTDTRGYGSGAKFDKEKFVNWAQNQDVPVYVSEYSMPEGWTEISSFDVPGMRGGQRQEKLFVQSKFAGASNIPRQNSARGGKMDAFRKAYLKRFPDGNPGEVISQLKALKSPVEQKAFLKRILGRSIH